MKWNETQIEQASEIMKDIESECGERILTILQEYDMNVQINVMHYINGMILHNIYRDVDEMMKHETNKK